MDLRSPLRCAPPETSQAEPEPVKNMQYDGLLHMYEQENRLIAFESGDLHAPSTLVFIGGLGDGLYAVPYIHLLPPALQDINFSLTQVLLSSSYSGYGFTSLENDVHEIRQLLRYLRSIGKSHFVLLGHSTGCQDIIKLFHSQNNDLPSHSNSLDGISSIILQAPVSDREYILDTLGEEAYKRSLKAAQDLVDAGEAGAAVPAEFSDMFSGGRCGISASRWLSLAQPLQDNPTGEDFFSSDLPTDLLTRCLEPVAQRGISSMVLISGRDETMPSNVDKERLLQRLAEEVKQELCTRIVDFIGATLACSEI
ncbi:hypothetical protein PCANC_00615 [Puccinia coronata f. sp. avenae]|uniref:AB hydrolase-1 domain-containing protein n=1 Tax=Puccinia coronata f. sp. avenae TaxID=200324 RepID=A0A2N5T467_9BASI|nr:hypothetical protein PCANC_07461 [Puccinia coronata f. sp. avenae]PLW58469.1 hypothetical protein PCANC_00615 [Puccinia coronata f. sp. avenae]